MITVKNESEIRKMERAGDILSEIMEELKKKIEPGIRTKQLEDEAQELVEDYGVKCSFKDYRGYPSCLCTSVNEEIVHVPPSQRKLKQRDLFSLDMGVEFEGYHSDMAFTVALGEVDSEDLELLKVTKQALDQAINQVKPGNRLGDIGYVIQNHAERHGFSVIRELCGHGIGQEVHQAPQVLNFGERGKGLELEPGMVICLEPMIAAGSGKVVEAGDHGFKTKDGSKAAHFEHTVSVTEQGHKILTEFNF